MNVLKFTKYTHTTKFILPLLFDDDTKYNKLLDNFFINAYIADMANKENDDKIHLLFADYPSLTLTQKLPESTTEYQFRDGYVLVYPLNTKWEGDYEKIIRGQYSTVSEEAKNRMLFFWEQDDTSLLWGVLYKKGKTVQKYFQDVTGDHTNKAWSRAKEWWIPFEIPDEMIGLT